MKWNTKSFIFNFDCRKIPKLLRFTLKVPAKFQNNVFVRATNNDFDQNTHVDFCNIQVTKKSVGKLGTQSIIIFYFILLLNFWSNTVVIYSWVCPHEKIMFIYCFCYDSSLNKSNNNTWKWSLTEFQVVGHGNNVPCVSPKYTTTTLSVEDPIITYNRYIRRLTVF